MARQSQNIIEKLKKILGSLRITKDNISNRSIEPETPETEEMLTVPAPARYNKNISTTILKSIVPDPEQFDGDGTKFEDWQRRIQLFLKSNRVVAANDKITIVLAQLREGIAGIYAQRKIDKLEETEDTQDQEEFVKKIKTAFSDKSKVADTEWKIETFRQNKKHIADFMIEFDVLAMKVETNEIHTIFLLKKNVRADIIKTILGYSPMAALEMLKEQKVAITLVGQAYKSMESRNDYKTNTGTMFRGQGMPMNIEKMQDNFDEQKRPKCFNCNTYGHIAKEYKKPKKSREIRKCYKCDKVKYLEKDCRFKQKMIIQKNQKKTDELDKEDEEKDFVEGSEQA